MHFPYVTAFKKYAVQYNLLEQRAADSEAFLSSKEYDEDPEIMAPKSSATHSIFLVAFVFVGYLAGWFMRMGVEHKLPTSVIELTAPRFLAIPEELARPMTTKIFRQNHTFDVERDDAESHQAWKAYFSRFISLDNKRSAGLPSSIDYHGRQVYSVAAYHQLHCVHVIRYAWGELKDKGVSVLDEPYPGMESRLEGYTIEGHVSHCLDMIRQALECFADPTLEPMMNDDGETLSKSLASGWGGTPHVCRDITALTEWIDAPEQFPIPSVETIIDT